MDQQIIDKLRDIVGEDHIRTSTAELYAYSTDAGIHRSMPDAVIRPRTTAEIEKIVKLANEYLFPIVPRGAGTALCGHSVPVAGGLVIDLQRMNTIKELHIEDLYVVVEPGVTHKDLNAELKKYGFFIPGPSSGNVANIGGMVATNASGGNAVKYGATRDYVLGMEVVFPKGDIAKLGSRTLKNSAGYQLEKLMCGMEGTLGIITEITLRIAPLPEATAVAVAVFDTLEKAGQCVANMIARPLIPSGLELMSRVCIEAVNKAVCMGLPDEEAILLIEVDGSVNDVKDQIRKVMEVCKSSGALSVDFTDDPERKEELWKGRKAMIPSLSKYDDDLVTVMLADDMAVPMSKVPEAVTAFQEISDKYDIVIASYGHSGDGNLHTKVLMDPTKRSHWDQAEKAVEEIYSKVMDLGGTITGEHGVGMTKAPFFLRERKCSLDAMKMIKMALDPNNIMNPNKIMDWEDNFISRLRYHLEEE
ncbi:FAD-binding oxidoreductase [Methanococcoides methylutens]|uniref:D-lactate dehydrogenase (cytochrome) n=1 Tax=Methanococcoides methylutens MM1 TaxID=1434104 RepID=A0A0E3SSI3_METMT|nr:FAD-binding oxidoreductase [Methanococcoides methylutens]AKB85508.1 FAD/FMN-containing dehydrogenase [Methanococcoides methylutens MM1]